MIQYTYRYNDEPDPQPVDGHDEEVSISEVLEIADAKEVEIFLRLVPDWKPRDGDSQTLYDRACEVAGNAHPFVSDYQIALGELRQQDPEFGHYRAPALEPKPFVQNVDDHGIITVPSHGNTGVLTVDHETEEELRRLPLKELARRAAADRHASLSERRKLQIKADEL